MERRVQIVFSVEGMDPLTPLFPRQDDARVLPTRVEARIIVERIMLISMVFDSRCSYLDLGVCTCTETITRNEYCYL